MIHERHARDNQTVNFVYKIADRSIIQFIRSIERETKSILLVSIHESVKINIQSAYNWLCHLALPSPRLLSRE